MTGAGLPLSMVDLAEACGIAAALKLMASFGGQEVKFPKDPPPRHPVLAALGETDGRAVCAYLAGGHIYVPHGRPARSARRDVLALQARGLSRGEIARLLGLSQRHVRRVANRADAPADGQLPLFGADTETGRPDPMS